MFLGRMLWGNGWWLVGEWLGMIKHDITIVNGGYSYSWVIDGVVHGWLMCICFQRNHAFKNTNNMWWLKDKFTMKKWFEVANPSLTTLVGVTVLHVFRKKTYIISFDCQCLQRVWICFPRSSLWRTSRTAATLGRSKDISGHNEGNINSNVNEAIVNHP
jgi:hypothetical protein